MPDTTKAPSQIEGYSFSPYIDLTPEETKRLSAMTRNARNVIYVRGFLVNTLKNKNGWRITDNKYIDANRGIAAGRSINFGPKTLGKAHHPNFYQDLDLTDKTPEEARKEFLQYQEWSRIGDILRIDYDKTNDKWLFYGAISHPNVVEAIQKQELELPRFVSPYFWNLNDPAETGDEIREAELFHVSFVDDPAYGPEVATIDAVCDSSSVVSDGVCAAQVFGLPAGKMIKDRSRSHIPPCACGLMASYKNKLDSSFYEEKPNSKQIQVMSDQSPTTPQQPAPQQPNTNKDNANKSQDEVAREAALATMKKYDEEANKAKANLDKNQNKEADPKNPTIPVEYQEVLNMAIEKDRAEQQKQYTKLLKEKDDTIESLNAQITKFIDAGRESILDSHIDKDSFKDEAEYKKRREFYSNLAKDLKMSNEQLEELMKGHYQVQEVKYLANKKKGVGAGVEQGGQYNTDPFGFEGREDNGFGKLSSSSNKGLGASTEDKEDADNNNAAASAILGAF